MKRVGLVSDSHGHLDCLKEAVKQMGDVDLIIHMGDYISDMEAIKSWVSIPVLGVKGNMDSWEPKGKDFLKTIIEGHQVYVSHGHRFGVKGTTNTFATNVKKNNCDIGIYGHTHKKDFSEKNGVILINPGSCALPNDDFKSFAVMTIDGKDVDVEFFEIDC